MESQVFTSNQEMNTWDFKVTVFRWTVNTRGLEVNTFSLNLVTFRWIVCTRGRERNAFCLKMTLLTAEVGVLYTEVAVVGVGLITVW